MIFQAEVKSIKSRKTSSLDIEYQIVLITNNPEVLALGALSGSEIIQVEVGKPKGEPSSF